MWILVISFAIILASKGQGACVKTSRDMCSYRVEVTCKEPYTLYDIPRDTNELLSFCSSWRDFLECLNGYDVACSGRSPFTALPPPLNYARLRRVLEDFCHVESSHHRTLLLHLPCMRQRIAGKSFLCKSTQDEVQASYRLFQKYDPKRMFSTPSGESECLQSISYLVCMVEVIKEDCGYSAYKEVDKIVTDSQLWPFWCGLETAAELQYVLDGMDLESDLKRSLKKYLMV